MLSHSRKSKKGFIPDPEPLPEQLRQALANTGRGHHSSTTTIPLPSSPSNTSQKSIQNIQSHIGNMSLKNFSQENFNQSISNQRNPNSPIQLLGSPQTTQITVQDQMHSLTSSRSSNQTPASGRGRSSSSSIVSRNTMTSRSGSRFDMHVRSQSTNIARVTREFHSHMEGLLVKIRDSDGISTGMKATLVEEVLFIGQEYHLQHRRIQNIVECAVREKNQSLSDLEDARRELHAALIDRDRALADWDTEKKTVADLKCKAVNDAENHQKLERYWKEIHDTYLQKINFQDEQLKGRRALLMDSNSRSNTQRDAMTSIRDPFQSPTFGSNSVFANEYIGSPDSPSVINSMRSSFTAQASSRSQRQLNIPPPFLPSKSKQEPFSSITLPNRTVRRRPNLRTQRAIPAIDYMGSFAGDNTRCYNTEPGSPDRYQKQKSLPPPRPSTLPDHLALGHEEIATHFQHEFSKYFSMIEGWVKIYASQPNQANDQLLARGNQKVWQYLMELAYPGQRQASHSHVTLLLNDARSRYWFVMRLIISLLLQDIMTLDLFERFGAKEEVELREVRAKLRERGLANEGRQQLIDEQTGIIYAVLESPRYNDHRNTQINFYTRRLRDMCEGLINESCDRNQAGLDLGAIIIFAYDLTVDMFTSGFSFQIFFPNTSEKFTASTMIARDQPRLTPLEIQLKQMRLKLVITPVVTMRDDHGTTIKAKNLFLATTLTMV